MRACLGYLFFAVLLSACRPVEPDLKDANPAWVGESLPHSFLAGFCASQGDRIPKFTSFHEEKEFFQTLSSDLAQNSKIKGLSWISVVYGSSTRGLPGNSSCHDSVIAQVDFHSESDALSLLSQWQRSGRIAFWEPNWLNRLSRMEPVDLSLRYAQDGRRWWTETIRLLEALEQIKHSSLDQGKELSSPVIAVLDGGIDYLHSSLSGRIWQNKKSSQDSLCPDDEWGCNTVHPQSGHLGTGDAHPYGTDAAGEFCSGRGHKAKMGDCMHATHIAGIIAGDVETGIPGVCPYCKVMNVRVLEEVDGEGRIPDSAVLRALKYVSLFERANGKNLVRVVNLSFGKYQRGKTVALFIKHLAKVRDGILVVAAAGNEDSQRRIYPAAHTEVLAVAGLAASGRKASYSNYGAWVNIAAPGGEIREGNEFAIESSVPGGDLSASQGTSMASPVVAGVAGLVLTLRPDISLSELRQTILDAADNRFYESGFADGYNFRNYYPRIDDENVPLLGVGILDASAAVLGVKRQTDAVKKKQRVQIHCASLAGSRPKGIDTSTLFFIGPLVFVFCLRRMERKKNHG